MRIGVDTGGTFTDFVFLDGKKVVLWKVPSTPENPVRAILRGLREAPVEAAGAVLVHGSTVATNALLERKIARVTLVTNKGLEDVLEIGRQARPELYALDIVKKEPLVPRSRRLGVAERAGKDGQSLQRLSPRELARLRDRVRATRPEAVAVGLLHSFLNGAGERRIGAALRKLGVPVSLSCQVAPEIREFERFSTTVADAALAPGVGRYLVSLEKALPEVKLFVFLSNGGLARAKSAARRPVRLVLSGPAGGAVAAARIAGSLRLPQALALDMGGTSTDVSLVRERPLRRGELEVGGLPLLVPSLDIHTVGAGGGSIAWIDGAGILRAGPRSAGSHPGPACYGHGEEPTVTDAHVVLGRLPGALAGGAVELDADRSHRALERLGKRLGLDRHRAAAGVLAVADATMARAARVVSAQRGVDPRNLPLIAFGGAGPLHAARLIQALPCAFAIVPTLPGNLSAHGMALADPERDLVRTILVKNPDRRRARIDRELARLVRSGSGELTADQLLAPGRAPRVERILDCRYVGQTSTLPIVPARSIETAFHAAHRAHFGHELPHRTVEVVNVRVRLLVLSRRPRPRPMRSVRARRAPASLVLGTRTAWFENRAVKIPIYGRETLSPGHRVKGPAVIEELTATTVVEPGFSATVVAAGHLLLKKK